jgi:hypothetical protein
VLGLGLVALVLGLMAMAALARPGVALGVLVGTVVLVPGSLPLPGGPGFLTVHRLVLLAAAAGLVRRCVLRELPWSVFRVPPLGYRFLLVVGALAVIGIGLVQPSTDAAAATRNWQAFAVQAVFLWVWVALLRATDDPVRGAVALVVASLVAAAIALVERQTGGSYARLWFHTIPDLLASEQAQELAVRGGRVRVRAAADFTLAYAWATAATLPLLLVLGAVYRGGRRFLLLLGLPLLGVAVVLTYSRTVLAPLIVAVLVVAVVLRDRTIRVATASMVGAGLLALVLVPSIGAQFTQAVDQGSIDVRVDRLPVVAELAAQHAYTGLGYSGLASQGVVVTDTSYLLTYAELGVVGLALFVGLLVAATAVTLSGARSPDPVDRRVAVASGVGAALVLVGTFTFDAFSASAMAETFWLLIALGLVTLDGVTTRRRAFPLGARVALVLAALAAGFVVRAAAPTHVAQTWQYETLRGYTATAFAPTYTGTELRATMCAVIRRTLADRPVTCLAAGLAPGQGTLRLEAPTREALTRDTTAALDAVHSVRQLSRLTLQTRGPAQSGTSTGLRTAPVWLPVLVGLWVLPVPGRRRRW